MMPSIFRYLELKRLGLTHACNRQTDGQTLL